MKVQSDSQIWRELGKCGQEQEWLTVLQKEGNRTWKEAGWKWNNSLQKADILIEKLEGDRQAGRVAEVAKRFKTALKINGGSTQSDQNSTLLQELCIVALEQLHTGRLSAQKAVRDIVVGKGKDRKGEDKKISVLLVLELDSGGTIHTNQLWQRVASILSTNLTASKREHKHQASTCAFGGDDDLLTEPFPQVKLPVLGSYFPLMSMASDADKAIGIGKALAGSCTREPPGDYSLSPTIEEAW